MKKYCFSFLIIKSGQIKTDTEFITSPTNRALFTQQEIQDIISNVAASQGLDVNNGDTVSLNCPPFEVL